MRAVVSYAAGTFLALALVSGLGLLLVAAAVIKNPGVTRRFWDPSTW